MLFTEHRPTAWQAAQRIALAVTLGVLLISLIDSAWTDQPATAESSDQQIATHARFSPRRRLPFLFQLPVQQRNPRLLSLQLMTSESLSHAWGEFLLEGEEAYAPSFSAN